MEGNWSDILQEAALLVRSLPKFRGQVAEAQRRTAQWRQLHPDVRAELAIDQPPGSVRVEYDLLLGDPEGGTLALTWRPDDGTPWSVCYADHWAANFVLSVDREHVTVQQALQSLRALGGVHPDLLTQLVDLQLVLKTAREQGIEVDDDEMQQAVDSFRARNGLGSATAMRAQLEQLNLSWSKFEETIRAAVLRHRVRDHVTASRIESHFETHRQEYDRLRVLQVRAVHAERAEELAARARHEGLLLALQSMIEKTNCSELSSTLSTQFASAWSGSLKSAQPGEIVGPLPEGKGYLVAEMVSRCAAELDQDTREAVREAIYREWLDERRTQATIQWHWM